MMYVFNWLSKKKGRRRRVVKSQLNDVFLKRIRMKIKMINVTKMIHILKMFVFAEDHVQNA